MGRFETGGLTSRARLSIRSRPVLSDGPSSSPDFVEHYREQAYLPAA